MRVLLVEDDLRLAEGIRSGLASAGISADIADGGEEGLGAAVATSYDAIVLDVMMHGLDGYEVVRSLRNRGVRTPVLMLTALDTIDDRVTGLEAGADDYLPKPFALRELVARVRALTRRHLDHRSAQLSAGNLVLDTAGHRLTVGGNPVELTTTEFAIMEFFMLHPGQTLHRDRIFENVWTYDFEGGGDNLVEVYIARLRKKFAAAGAPDLFVTIRNAGYRFDPEGPA
jgi:two-component system OmpR family response regulator